MKIDGKTIPAPQNLKRRESFLLEHKDKLQERYLKAQLMIVAHTRVAKKLRWETKQIAQPVQPKSEIKRVEEPKKRGFIDRIKGAFKAQRGN